MQQPNSSLTMQLKKRFNWLLKNVYLDGFLHLLFPSNCLCCDGELLANENSICSVCMHELPFTTFELYQEPSELDELFWGRVPVYASFSLLFYEKTNVVKPILQALKYKGRSDVGIQFGQMIGEKLIQLKAFKDVQVLIPVPIHIKKRYVRGYNQTEVLANGLAKVWNVKVDTSLISKSAHTKSQTTFGRFMRWDNVKDQFYISDKLKEYSSIAILDDVITTGATSESIMRSILEINPQIRISVISLAVTK